MAIALLTLAFVQPQAAPILGPTTAVPVEIDSGERLFVELGCGGCHPLGQAQARLAGRRAPTLGKDGVRVTPQFLRAWLSEPHAEKPGTLMPNIMHGVPDDHRDAAVEALTHFLAQHYVPEEKVVSAEAARINEGRLLYHQIGCVACHAPFDPPKAVFGGEASGAIAPALVSESVPLTNLARKLTVAELAKFLRDPVKYRKGGRMPSLNLSENEAAAVAMYLLREQAPDPNDASLALKKAAGLRFTYHEGEFRGDENFDALPVVHSGASGDFSLAPRKREQNFGFRFAGLVKAPRAGLYGFGTYSDDGSRVYVAGKLVVDNWGDHAPQEKDGKIELTEGEHEIVVLYYNNVAGHELRVFWEPPGGARQKIPSEALSHMARPMVPSGAGEFAVDPAKVERGEALFNSMNCSACHDNADTPAYVLAARSFKEMAATGGCLEEEVAVGLPDFQLNATQREALKKLLENRERYYEPLTPEQTIIRRLSGLNCYACHSRDAKGGPTEARLEYFSFIGETELGDEGRIPPHLTKIGAKLKKEAIRGVIAEGATVRPYMATRMPQFGASNVEALPELFETVDDTAEDKRSLNGTARDEKFGRRLVGVGGLACIQCHNFAGRKSLGIPALDLTLMSERLKPDWFYRYLINPASLRPGTRMPTFWPEGVAVNKEIFDGDTDAQILAIWAYLSLGREADLPPGLVVGKKEIVVENETVIYRNFIRGAGTRGIGVGYPEKANLAFDANDLRIAVIWQGSFIDAARHSSGRGEGFEPPLGDRVQQLAPGPTFARLGAENDGWPAKATNPEYKFGGYRLDEKQRPTFLYTIHGIQAQDSPLPVATDLDPYFQRKIKLLANSAADGVWFRAAAGNEIEALADGTFLIDKRVTMKIAGAEARVRESEGKKELVAPVEFVNGVAQITQEIRW